MGETNLVNWNYKLSIIYPPLTSISSYVNFSSPALYVSIHWSFKQLALVVCYINWYGIYMPLFNKAYCIDACCTIICVSFVNQTLSLGWHLSIRDYKCPFGIQGSGALPAHCLCQHYTDLDIVDWHWVTQRLEFNRCEWYKNFGAMYGWLVRWEISAECIQMMQKLLVNHRLSCKAEVFGQYSIGMSWFALKELGKGRT